MPTPREQAEQMRGRGVGAMSVSDFLHHRRHQFSRLRRQWSAGCPQRTGQYHLRSRMVTIASVTTRAIVDSLRKLFWFDGSARRANLTRLPCVNFNQPRTSVRSFVSQLVDEDGPRGIVDAPGQSCAGQTLDVQVLDGDQLIAFHQVRRMLVAEVLSLGCDSLVNPLQPTHRLAPVPAALDAPRHPALSMAKPAVRPFHKSRVRNRAAVAHRCKRRQAHVDANGSDATHRLLVIIDQDLSEPTIRASDDPEHALGCGDHAVACTEADKSELWNAKQVVAANIVIRLDELHRIKLTPRLESRVSRLLTSLHSPEERQHRSLGSTQRAVAGEAEWNRSQRFTPLPHCCQPSCLIAVLDRFATAAIRLGSHLKRSIVKPAAFSKPRRQRSLLRVSQIKLGFDGLEQSTNYTRPESSHA